MMWRVMSVTLRLCLLSLAYVEGKSGKQLVRDVVAQICPFSTYCHTNATRKLVQGYTKYDLCCGHCSCEPDCWKLGNCCIDKDNLTERSPIFNCKESVVKKYLGQTSSNLGFDEKHRRYLIIDYCPEAKVMPVLETKCRSKQPKSLEELVWVSDKESGIIYQNQYCAECHGIENYTHWQISTQCDDAVRSNFSSLFKTLSSDNCYINVIAPNNMRDIVADYSCFLSTYDKCNQTGLWSNFDQDILSACDNFDSAVFQPDFTSGYRAYKNIFCYLCNEQSTFLDFCPNRFMGAKTIGISFSALLNLDLYINLRQKGNKKQGTSRCYEDEFFDIYTERCRKLVCPYGQVPLYGICKQMALATDGLTVKVNYYVNIHANSDHSALFVDKSNQKSLGIKLINKFLTLIGLRKLKCGFCDAQVYATKNVTQTSGVFTGFYIHGTFYTNANCQLHDIVKLAKEFVKKTWKVQVTDNNYLILQAQLETRAESEVIQTSELMFSLRHSLLCEPDIDFPSEQFCPAVDLNYLEVSSFEDAEKKPLLMALFEAKQHSNGVLSLCLDEYYSFMSQILSAAALSWNGMRYQLGLLFIVFQALHEIT